MGRSETVTVLMNDIVGSTALRVTLGDDRADELFADLVGRWRVCLLDHDGREIKGLGDGLMAIFRSAADAVSCGIAMQQAVWAKARDAGDVAVEMRVALSAGEAAEDDGDWHGTPVVEATRLCDAATPGQVLVSDVVRALVGSRGSHRFHDAGLFDLKGLPEPVHACSVLWEPPIVRRVASLPAPLEVAGRSAFVGRREALGVLDDARKLSMSAGRQMVLVSGEPGQGKTRLTAEAARRAAADSSRVLFGRCDEDLQRAYRPWTDVTAALIAALPDEALDQHLEAFGGSLARLGPALERRRPGAPLPPPLDPAAEPLVLADVVVDLITRDGLDAPVMIVLDDLHWADRPSLLLLKALLQIAGAVPLVIVGTYRDTDLDRTHPLSSLVGDLRREAGVQRLALSGLDADEVGEFVDAAAGQEVAASEVDLVRVLHAETNGNPLFLGEVLRYFMETGALVRHEGEWQRAGDLDVPEGLKEVVGRRLDRLPQLANDALQVAAIVGPSFDLEIVERVLDADAEALIEAIEVAARSGVVDELSTGGDRFQFRHAVLRAVIEGELSSVRRALLHRKVGDALEQRYAGVVDEHLDELAFHRVEAARAGDANEAARWCVRAANRAIEDVRFADALAAVERGWQVLELADPAELEVRCDLAIAGQWAMFWFPGDAVNVWHDRAVADAGALGDPVRQARASCWILRPIDDMQPLLAEQAEALAKLPAGERELRRLLLSCYTTCLTNAGAPIETLAPLSEEQLELAHQLGDEGGLFDAVYTKLMVLAGQPTLGERRAVLAELKSFRNAVGMYAFMSVDAAEGMICLSSGDRRGFEEKLQDLHALAGRHHSAFRFAQTAQWRATLALLDGRYDEVEERSARQLEGLSDESQYLLAYFGQLVAQRRNTGRGEEFLATVDDVIAEHPNFPILLVIRAAICASVGRVGEAGEIIDRLSADAFSALGRGVLWPTTLAHLVDAVVDVGAVDHARTLVPLVEPWSGQMLVAGAGLDVLGAADRFLGMLELTLEHVDRIDERFWAAVALERRLEAPPLVARTRYWWARGLLARGAAGDAERAAALLAQCLETAEALGMTLLAANAAQASALP